jgi:hypothetical protein
MTSIGIAKRAGIGAAMALAWALAAGGASAHNGVKLEQDECVFKIGPSTMHFIAYQREGEEQEFCQDIAKTGPTIVAISTVSEDMRDMAIGVRVVKEGNESGQAPEVDLAPKVYRNGILTFEHNFATAGKYVGVVTLQDDLGNRWESRFPFTVGVFTFIGYLEYILYGVGFSGLCAGLWFYLGRHKSRASQAEAPAPAE